MGQTEEAEKEETKEMEERQKVEEELKVDTCFCSALLLKHVVLVVQVW